MICNFSDLRDKYAVITGSTGGIGLEIAEILAKNSVNLILPIRSKDSKSYLFLEKLSELYNIKVEFYICDLSSESSVVNFLRYLYKNYKNLDILVNNAAVADGSFIQFTSSTKIREVMSVNFIAPVLFTQYISKIMKRNQTGSIVNICSVAGTDRLKGYTSYGCSKSALLQFTKVASAELADFGIRVNAVSPGLIATDMSDEMESKAAKELINRSLFKRLGSAEEVANVVVFLCSNVSSFVNGQNVRVDGGY